MYAAYGKSPKANVCSIQSYYIGGNLTRAINLILKSRAGYTLRYVEIGDLK